MHSLVHTYSKLFYDQRVAVSVEAELALMGRKPTNAERLRVTKRLTGEAWSQEDEQTISLVTSTRDAEKAAIHAVADDSVERTPEDYQRYV